MFIGVHSPSKSGGGNKGSSSTLMDYLSKEDVELLDTISEKFLEENEGSLEALELEKLEYENSIKELEEKMKKLRYNDIPDSNDLDLLDHYKEKLEGIESEIELLKENNLISFDEENNKFSLDELQTNENKLFELNAEKEQLKKEINSDVFILNNKDFDDDTYIKLQEDLERKEALLKKMESDISVLESEKERINTELKDKEKTFFTSNFDNCTKAEAIELIDKQSKGLEKNDTKFFMLSVDPSENEIKHLLDDIVENVELINSTKDLTPEQKEAFEIKLKDYTHSVMEAYAEQFDRTKKNGEKLDRNDLVYVAKIESERKYSHKDKDVVFNREIQKEISKVENSDLSEGQKKQEKDLLESELRLTPSGEVIRENLQKEGFQNHVHIVVSRYDKDKEMKLSPMANSKGQNDHKVGGRDVQIGFNRVDFKIRCEEKFDQQFAYNRPDKDKTAVMIQDRRNQKSNNLDVRKVVNKEGKVDTLEAYKMYASTLKSTGELLLTGKTKNLDPNTLINKFSKEINPAEKLQSMINQINPKELAISSIKKAITKGGLEL